MIYLEALAVIVAPFVALVVAFAASLQPLI